MHYVSTTNSSPGQLELGAHDHLTILHVAEGHSAAKFFGADGVVANYKCGKFFSLSTRPVSDIFGLSQALRHLERDPTSFVVRGEPRPGTSSGPVRRLSQDHEDGTRAAFEEKPRRYLCVDIDDVDAPVGLSVVGVDAVKHVIRLLPSELHAVTVHYQFSSSAGTTRGGRKIKLHLWYWLDRPYASAELKRWARRSAVKVDASLFQAVQPHYTAAPIFENAADDPFAAGGRSGLIQGGRDAASLPVPDEDGQHSVRDDEHTSDIHEVAQACGWMKHCIEDVAELPEPEWYAMLSIVGRCRDGERHAHDVSRGYRQYSPSETSAKLQHALSASGPRTCANIRQSFGDAHCRECPLWGKIKTPLVAGLPGTSLLRRYVYLAPTLVFRSLDTGREWTKEQFSDLNATEVTKGLAANWMLRNPLLKKFEVFEYRPGEPEFLGEAYNVWRTGGVEPTPGDAQPFLDHVSYVIPDDVPREHFLNWLAFNWQRPGRKVKHAVLLIGGQGIGKSYLSLDLLSQLFGQHNVSAIDTGDIKGSWTDWVAEKTHIVVEELNAFGQLEAYNKLKPFFTQGVVRVNKKNKAQYDAPNLANWFITSNHPNPIKLEPDDRRFFVYRSPATPRTTEYYDGLVKWTAGNLGVIAHYLQHRDITAFNPDAPPPMTDAKAALIEISREPLEQIARELIEDGQPPFGDGDLVVAADVQRALYANGATGCEIGKVTRVLRKLGYVSLAPKKVRAGDGPRATLRCWARRDLERWTAASGREVEEEIKKGKSGRAA